MKKNGLYSSGQFANMAHVTKKTLRYYDEHNILKPSFVDENGAKYYSDNDFAKLQQIIFLKYLSFPLADIKELTVRNADRDFWVESLEMQTSLIDEHIAQLSLMKKSLSEAKEAIKEEREVNWSEMLLLASSNEMEQKLKQQYINTANISARIYLHNEFSTGKEGWFVWLYDMADIKPGEKVLELGCGDGSFWMQNKDRIHDGVQAVLTDISDGIVRETARKLEDFLDEDTYEEKCKSSTFSCQVMDAHFINAKDDSFDVVIANHMLFYCEDLPKVFAEIRRVLKPGGRLVCSTYSAQHMQEISSLVQEFDDRIALSADKLYEIFGKETGGPLLKDFFKKVDWHSFEDGLIVTRPEPLIAYIMSCHGNQNRYIVDKYHDFYAFVKKKTDNEFHITKDAGVFIAQG